MSRHDDRVRIRHMLDHAKEALELTRSRTRQDLDTDRVLKPGGMLLVMTMAGDPPSKLVPHFDPEPRCEVINGVAVRYFGRPDDLLYEVSDSGLTMCRRPIILF